MEKIQYITALDKFEGLSLRAISRKTGLHQDTVKKYLNKDNWNEKIKPRKTRESELDPLKPIIDKWLKDDLNAPRKQRHKGTHVYDRLNTEEEFKDQLKVGLQTVISYVSKAKKELTKSTYGYGNTRLPPIWSSTARLWGCICL